MDSNHKETSKHRVAYLKNGDVADEIKHLKALNETDILDNGGPYHYLGSFLKWAEGLQVLLISLDLSYKHIKTKSGINAYVLNTKKFGSIWEKITLQIISLFKILIILVRYKPELILCAISGGVPFAVSYLVAKCYKIPFIHTRHMRIETYKPSIVLKLKNRFDIWLIRKSDAVLCNGPYLEDQLNKIGVNEEKIVKFDLPYRKLKYLRDKKFDERPVLNYKCKLLYLGRLEEKKGALDLFNAVTEISKTNDISLTYIGNGKLSKELISKTNKLGLKDKVNFLGELPHTSAMK